MNPPQNPAGPFEPISGYSEEVKLKLIDIIEQAPARLRQATTGLSDDQLDTLYKNWSIRQIVNHLNDSHANSYVRVKWTLTEENPTIKAYQEEDWSLLDDAKAGDIEPALAMFTGLHQKWTQVFKSMTEEQFRRTFFHPQTSETVNLWTALNYYAWHCRHHTGQILWLRDQNGW